MLTITASKARACFSALMDEVAASHEPILITGNHNNVVMISAENWRSVNETLYLVSVPGMRKSLIEGMHTPIEDFDTKVDW